MQALGGAGHRHVEGADRAKPPGERPDGPLLISLAYATNYLLSIPDAGITIPALAARSGDSPASIKSHIGALTRWSYVTEHDGVLLLTDGGRRARDTWAPLDGEIEQRWRARFGADAVDALCWGLDELVVRGGASLPVGFPILAWDRAADRVRPVEPDEPKQPNGAAEPGELGLSTLLARALVTLALDFEASSTLSLAMSAILLPALAHPVPLRQLPGATGVSKEAIAIGVGWLRRSDRVTEDPKLITLTAAGTRDAAAARDELQRLGERWPAPGLRTALAAIVGPSLALGLTPPPDGWRWRAQYRTQTEAMLANPQAALPRFPMVSHRGGYPDGS